MLAIDFWDIAPYGVFVVPFVIMIGVFMYDEWRNP
jgi:hypothetical protein